MTYSQKTLAKIGRIVIKNHPDIATGIIENWPVPQSTDLSKIPIYFNTYCQAVRVSPENIKGEVKKVFVSAMITIYCDQYLFKKSLSITLSQDLSYTCRMVDEVQFRYRKDEDFKDKVNNIINLILT